ncbi:hypothetical protein [Spongiivirga citrea]|uniref:DoxX family protein n=1 Tax=Spongiivirga citrea TaxID=1481457 RepID=A0A6M0CIE8_9FLAO|nr:hypothetical protein [Spongiivirga citrea]NER16723.1 hypothetical protein [Spongiivirga citrea]
MTNLNQTGQSFLSRYLLRFLFLYIVLYIYPYGFEYIQELTTSDISFWQPITIWFGETFLGWEFNKDYLLNGFDSKYDFSRFLLIACLAIIGAFIWVFIDSKLKTNYNNKLKVLFKTILRYHVGLTLIIYGLSKVFMLQFGEMDLDRLENTTGNHNGMRYLWDFMSYSEFYTRTSGWVEVLGGALLLFRRTTFIGAFISFIAMANVVLIDIGYDVRVKMFAIHLFLMTLLILGEDIKRMIDFFIRNKPTTPMVNKPLLTGKTSKKIGYFIKGGLLTYYIISCFISYTGRIERTHNDYPYMVQYHTVDLFIKNGDTIENEASKWKNISINGMSYWPETFNLITEDDNQQRFSFELDTVAKQFTFQPARSKDSTAYILNYQNGENKSTTFKGIYSGDTLEIKTSYKTFEDYPLTKSRFKWITDLK